MRKQSQMGSSKYEFNLEQLDIDVMNNILKAQIKKNNIKELVIDMFTNDPVRMDETFSMFCEVLREVKSEYKL